MGERKLNFKKVCKVDQIVERIKGWIRAASIEKGYCEELISIYGQQGSGDWATDRLNELDGRIEALEDVLNLFKEQGYDGE